MNTVMTLAYHKVPHLWRFVSHFPQAASGKPQKFGDKWTVLVFGSLCDHHGRRCFNAIRRDIPGISQKSLTQCLRRLERNGLLQRYVYTSAGGWSAALTL